MTVHAFKLGDGGLLVFYTTDFSGRARCGVSFRSMGNQEIAPPNDPLDPGQDTKCLRCQQICNTFWIRRRARHPNWYWVGRRGGAPYLATPAEDAFK